MNARAHRPPPLPFEAHPHDCQCLDCWSQCWFARAELDEPLEEWTPPRRSHRVWRLTLFFGVPFAIGWFAVSTWLRAESSPQPPVKVAPATASVTMPLAASAPFELPPRDIAALEPALEPAGAIAPAHHHHHHHHQHHHHHHHAGVSRHARDQLASASDWVDPFSR